MTISKEVRKAQLLMNQLGAERVPFYFQFDFALERAKVIPIAAINSSEVLFDFNGYTNSKYTVSSGLEEQFFFHRKPPSPIQYHQAFQVIQKAIRAGDSYLVNLTFPTAIKTNLSLKTIFDQSTAKYRLYQSGQFVCFSPETFVAINGLGKITSYPMKGTIEADSLSEAKALLGDAKETAEHATIVDLIRNDLSSVAQKVQVEQYRYLEKVSTHIGSLWQTSSRISGELGMDFPSRLGDVFVKLLPAGSITGAPKKRTVEIIQSVEGYDRGYYTGIAGIFDGYSVDSTVLIRFIEQTDQGLIFKSGGGITAYSDWEKEYQEIINKVYLPLVITRQLAPA